jgi:hypothetical protein
MVNNRQFSMAAIIIASFNQSAFAQHGDFAPKVQMILDYLKDSGEACISPDIPGARSFKACREGAEPVVLTIVTDIPVRDDDGRVADTCPGRLTATQVPGLPAVKMEVFTRECPQKTLTSGEFSRIFVGIILELAEWVQKKARPI